MEIQNKVAIVTGGASGIGKAIVIHFLEKGIKGVFILDLNKTDGKKLENELKIKYGSDKIWFIETDVTNSKTFEDAFKEAISIFGKIDILINNAGIADDKNFERMINVNLNAVITGTHLGYKHMSKMNGGLGGAILNIASIAGLNVFYPMPEYAASKTGVIGFVRALGHSHHHSSGVNVTALCPGFTSTNISNNLMSSTLELIKSFASKEPKQNAESVAKSVSHIIKYGNNGSVWVIDGGNLYKKNFPDIINDPTIELIVQNI